MAARDPFRLPRAPLVSPPRARRRPRLAAILLPMLAACASGATPGPSGVAPPPDAAPVPVESRRLSARELGAIPAGVAVEAHELLYDVTGTTAAELREAMLRHGLVAESGRPVYGRHRWRARWSYRGQHGIGTCALRDARVQLTLETTLPRWRAPADAPAALVAEWGDFVRALDAHEREHRRLSLEAGREIARALRTNAAGSCAVVGEQANAAARHVIEAYRGHNRAYDDSTRHGLTQGAVWPPPRRGGVRPPPR